ncbi:MAG TPA: LpxD N-terminal domain-containing protein, partial [Rudaea sp.]|nr:LpxD N-terminal domain-containing protein [Rudaea sp.]
MSAAHTHTLSDLAARFGLQLRGDGGLEIHGVGTLAKATPQQLSFLSNPHYRGQLADCEAGAIVVQAEVAADCPGACLIADDAYVAFAKIAALFDRVPPLVRGIHPTAIVAPDAMIAADACIGPGCVIEQGARIDAGAMIGPHCIVGHRCHVGPHTRLIARVTLVRDVHLGKRVLVHPGAVIGADGFG